MIRELFALFGVVVFVNAQANQPIYNANNNVPIVKYESMNNDGEAGYSYAFETGDGTAATEQGFLKDADSPSGQDGFAFTSPDGQRFEISYTADENGFLPQGAHIPTPPPIPAEILKVEGVGAECCRRGVRYYRPRWTISS